MLLVSLISYIDRNTLALLAPTILADTGLSSEQYGYIISAFSIAYMIGNPVWGAILDRYGVRPGMFSAVSFWTLASVAHAFAGGLWSFATARALLGFGEGATFPGGLQTTVQTLPENLRSRGIAVSFSGGSLGAIVTPLIVTPIAIRYGWRGAFWFTGLVGVLWLLIWAVVSRRLPRHMPQAAATHKSAMRFRDRRLWAFMCAYGLGALPLAFVLYGSSLYLARVRGLSQAEVGALLWIPPLGWEIGYFFWGWIADRARDRHAQIFALLTGLSLVQIAIPRAPTVPLVMAGFFFVMFVGAGFIIVSIAHATSVFPATQSGMIAGAGAGSWSAMVALVMPVFGRFFDQGRYDQAFLFATVWPILGYTAWRALTVRYLKFEGAQSRRVLE